MAIEECREKGLKCGECCRLGPLLLVLTECACSPVEYFGAERVTSGDEDKKHEEKEAESGEEGKAARAMPNILPSKSDPE